MIIQICLAIPHPKKKILFSDVIGTIKGKTVEYIRNQDNLDRRENQDRLI